MQNRCGGEGLTSVLDEDRTILKVFCDVVFDISKQEGSNVTYFFDFGYQNQTGSPVTVIQVSPDYESFTKHLFVSFFVMEQLWDSEDNRRAARKPKTKLRSVKYSYIGETRKAFQLETTPVAKCTRSSSPTKHGDWKSPV